MPFQNWLHPLMHTFYVYTTTFWACHQFSYILYSNQGWSWNYVSNFTRLHVLRFSRTVPFPWYPTGSNWTTVYLGWVRFCRSFMLALSSQARMRYKTITPCFIVIAVLSKHICTKPTAVFIPLCPFAFQSTFSFSEHFSHFTFSHKILKPIQNLQCDV